MGCICTFGAVLIALFTRIVFALHCLIAFWRIIASVPWIHYYWFIFAGLVGLFIESIFTIYCRKGAEYKW